ncbi:uncharacterized protein LOC129353532 [Poeciliopsis prolifica]|uniref:uncharacterized protein LOC129353532 n=1 Tax=Poeciliopsis prolifica TaxID=188132 RepID=UPI0024141490|nr:uncharacterized protein LOC129353532 [Poeciliopsis prolifica]
MNINILGTKVHDALVVFGALCVLVLFGCVGVISWGGWKINQQDEKHSEDTTNLKSLTEELKNENEKSQNETEKLSSKMENLNGKLKEETENLNQTIQLMQKFNTFLFDKYCNGKECLLCHKGWIFFSDSCYFLSSDSLSWDQSRRFCQLKSADLVVINNQQEQKFIYNNINNGYYWLGLQSNGNNWVWIDGYVDTLRWSCMLSPDRKETIWVFSFSDPSPTEPVLESNGSLSRAKILLQKRKRRRSSLLGSSSCILGCSFLIFSERFQPSVMNINILGGWKINQQDEKHSEDTTYLKSLTDKLKNENEKSQNETEKLSSKMENLNGKLKEETENLNQTIQLMQKFNTFLFNKYCNGKECLLCHKGWIFFSDSCYFLSSDYLSWDQSRAFCQLKSADLVVINNQQEQKFIYGNINNHRYWLGIQSDGSNWFWIDGRVDTLMYWNYNYYYNGPYAVMYRSGNPTASWGTSYSSSSTHAPSVS